MTEEPGVSENGKKRVVDENLQSKQVQQQVNVNLKN